MIKEEDALVTEVKDAMTTIIDHVSDAKRDGMTLDEEFDLVFNPLPGEIVLHAPNSILVAKRSRHSSPTVTVDEVEKALASRLRPAGAYRVRWVRSSGS